MGFQKVSDAELETRAHLLLEIAECILSEDALVASLKAAVAIEAERGPQDIVASEEFSSAVRAVKHRTKSEFADRNLPVLTYSSEVTTLLLEAILRGKSSMRSRAQTEEFQRSLQNVRNEPINVSVRSARGP